MSRGELHPSKSPPILIICHTCTVIILFYENPANHTPSPSSSRKMCIRRHYCYINTHFLRTSRASGVLSKTRNVLIENRSARRTRKKCLRRPRSCQADRRRKLYHGYPLANKPGNVQCTLHVVSEFIPRSSS